MTSSEIQYALWKKYKHHNWRIMNVYFFREESDFLTFLPSGMCWEFEVKVSRSDFFNDFKKEKHKLFESKTDLRVNIGTEKHPRFITIKKTSTPNRFYFAVPEGMVSADEVPDYAGLVCVGHNVNWAGSVNIIKQAPTLHKSVHDHTKLLEKYYWNYVHRTNDMIYQHYLKRQNQLSL